jgi:hypothetical protein
MNEQDSRCCGSGVCIINAGGECWCGQVWNGKEMVAAGTASENNKPSEAGSQLSHNPDLSDKI